MSAPSSDGPPSISSEPSATSSRTLHSRGSGAYVEDGEGSSKRQSFGGPLATGSADEHDFARRRQRVRRSGGFLLDSSFASGPRKGHGQYQARAQDIKGKRSSHLVEIPTSDGQQDDGRRGRMPANSSPLSHASNARPTTPQPPAIDPNQLVHMALNLSESRRRNISAGPLLASQPRITSGAQREGSFSNNGVGGSLRQYLNEQRRVSRNLSPITGRSSPSRHMSTSMQRSGSMAFHGSQNFNPSAATIARRNKASDYIELRIEYMRLLELLPPLKLDANAPGNFIVSSTNMPGSPHAELTRVPSHLGKQHELGRPYNPLQYIRNRRTRARERRALDHTPQEFADVHEVRAWVDLVEHQSKYPGYRRDDGVSLPRLHEDHASSNEPKKLPRSHKGWVFSPEELLADAYWVEQGDNKTIIENRHGRKIFPPKEVPKPDFLQPRASKEYSDKRRRSWVEGVAGVAVDSPSGGESENGSARGRKRRLLPGFRADSPKHGKHSRRGSRLGTNIDSDSSDSDAEAGKHRLRIIVDEETNTGPLALQLEIMLKQQANEIEGKSSAIISPDTPNKLERHHADEPDGKVSRDSLEVPRFGNGFTSVEHPRQFKMPPRVRTTATLGDDIEPRSSFEDPDTTAPNTPLHEKRFPPIGSNVSPPRSRDSSVTRKTKRSKLNPFHSHDNSEDHVQSHYQDHIPVELDKKQQSRQTSEETQDSGHVGHAIMAAPNAVRSLLTHRKNDSTSSLPSPDKIRRRDTQEPHSAVTRFFKGVKHEGSKVGVFVFRRDRPDDEDTENMPDVHTAEYGTDTSVKGNSKSHRPRFSRSATATTTASTAPNQDDRYHIELPSFRPAHESQIDADGKLMSTDHISRQNHARKNSRSPRFDRLAPLRMDLERLSTVSSQTTVGASRSHSPDKLKKALAHSGDVGPNGTPPAGLRDRPSSENLNKSSSRPTLDGRRQWSITDEDGHTLHRKAHVDAVTQADIARVRALFLCSGVKAKEISRRASAKRSPPSDFLARAAATANRELTPVSRKEEHVLAARILMHELESSTRSLSASTQHFRNKTIKELTEAIMALKSKVDSDLMPRIFEGGDVAVRITSEISGQGPLQVKQITDDIDRMMRARRRRMRWLRGFGWMLVEWALVAFMWWLWLVSPSSLGAVAAAFIPTALTAALFTIAFVLIRQHFPNIYFPRTFIGTIPKKDRTPCQNRSYWDWVHTMKVVPDKFMLYHQSLDSYLFLRFLRTLIFICVVGACITWPILMPVNATGGGNATELNRISIGNVKKRKHLYAHAAVAWVFFSFVMFTVARERLWLIGLRQAWNLSKTNAKRLSRRTVLFLSAPTAALDKVNMQRFFGADAVRVWPVTKADELHSLVSSRNSLVEELEGAELSLIKKANKRGRKRQSKNSRRDITYDSLSDGIRKSMRPTHRLKTSPPIGKQVDSIDWYREQIKKKEEEIEKARDSNESVDSHGGAAAVFVEFRSQAAAQRACQQIASADIMSLTPRYTGVLPNEVIWENLTIAPARRLSQHGIAIALVIATIVFWSIPVSLVGAISNIGYLADNVKWLEFLNRLPPQAISLLSGLLPPLLLSMLASYVPKIFRYIFKTFGEPTNTSAEIRVLKWYFVFQVLQVFLVTTLASGAAAVASQIARDPASIPQLLADKLPSASNTYLTYFVIQGLSNAPSNVLNYSDVLSFLFFDKFFDKTPRQKYMSYTYLRGMQWGKLFPKYVNFVIIAIAYACIAPLVLGFAAIGLAIFYYSYRYQLLYTVQPKVDTKGHCYTLALQQILTGVYIAELCLFGLFSLRKATGPTIMIAILFVATVVFNYTTNRYFAPLEQYLPADLALESEDDEQAPLLSAAEEGEADALHNTESGIERLSSRSYVPSKVVTPVAQFLQPHIFASHTAMKAWLRDGDFDPDDVPEYSEEDVRKAYLNPAYTSKTPIVWLARDSMGVSKNETQENESAGLECSDQGAYIDEKGDLKWSVDDFEEIPVFKKGTRW
ncbi:hypothetical protein BDU57DRAFT_480761 [Ampelomyces quisqualis]|uniref:DUF221-domain-containing protein n=1 Tax=Ampelomyces quisqualis TaxID=50730 RepID=A0A6A5QHL5_AMPQU|nr:hypothetical protein BDU57DRAFT_480761 [Ampelomyces quisqualis]